MLTGQQQNKYADVLEDHLSIDKILFRRSTCSEHIFVYSLRHYIVTMHTPLYSVNTKLEHVTPDVSVSSIVKPLHILMSIIAQIETVHQVAKETISSKMYKLTFRLTYDSDQLLIRSPIKVFDGRSMGCHRSKDFSSKRTKTMFRLCGCSDWP